MAGHIKSDCMSQGFDYLDSIADRKQSNRFCKLDTVTCRRLRRMIICDVLYGTQMLDKHELGFEELSVNDWKSRVKITHLDKYLHKILFDQDTF